MAMSDAEDLSVTQIIDLAQPEQKNDLVDTLRKLAQATGRSPSALIGDFVKTSFGPGKLSFEEYVAFGLYDPARHAGSDIRSFVGLRAMERIWSEANFRIEFYGLLANKIASCALLAAHGFPVIPTAALFCTEAGFESAQTLRSREALRRFLTAQSNFPFFAKPVDGFQSLGAASFVRYDAAKDALIDRQGASHALDGFLDEVTAHYGSGYLLQPQMSPHPNTAAICGSRLATVRVLTICANGDAKILRVCEKLPAGANIADNYWRSGNLLVQLDTETGMRGRAISGKGFAMREHSHHPDSGHPIAGTTVPHWGTVRELALQGAHLFKDTAMIGWDIAPVETGAVIVEVNETPDLVLPQLADRRGILDAALESFLAERRLAKAAWQRALRLDLKKRHRATFWG